MGKKDKKNISILAAIALILLLIFVYNSDKINAPDVGDPSGGSSGGGPSGGSTPNPSLYPTPSPSYTPAPTPTPEPTPTPYEPEPSPTLGPYLYIIVEEETPLVVLSYSTIHGEIYSSYANVEVLVTEISPYTELTEFTVSLDEYGYGSFARTVTAEGYWEYMVEHESLSDSDGVTVLW